jgi:lipoprotein-anchoring transpeptidase ErfK/SrfK
MIRALFLAALALAGSLAALAPAEAASGLIVARPPSMHSPDMPSGMSRVAFTQPQTRPSGFIAFLFNPNKPYRNGGGGKYQSRQINPAFLPRLVRYTGKEKPGTIVIDTDARFLYLVLDGGMAKRYGVGVGRPGFEWAGAHSITRKAEWPTWTPPPEMVKRQPWLPASMKGGPRNPLGARALYLGSTEYRIHGSNEPWTIGTAVSSGCIRMRNEDVIDLYGRVGVGTRVIVM